jgi:hypothetical protein
MTAGTLESLQAAPPMKLALLGADEESLALADAAVAAGHAMAWQGDIGSADRAAHPWLADDDRAAQWEDLLDPAAADGVVVGVGGENVDGRVRQVHELAKFGRPLLAVHPLAPSVLSFFEIDMARTESGAMLQHFNPLVEPATLVALAEWVEGGHPLLGAVEQVVAVRTLGDRSRQQVLWHFARDVELLGRVAGRLDRLGAHAPAAESDAAYAALSVQLLGPRQIPVRWAVEPLAGAEGLRVSLVCERGRVTIVFDSRDRLVELVEHTGERETHTEAPLGAPEASATARFVAAIETGDAAASTWPAALEAMELADSIELSLRRGRMIDVHRRELTEQLAFKGLMSALGCGVLVLLIPLVIVLSWAADWAGAPLAQYWPHALLAFLAVFLALQALPKMMLAKNRGAERDQAK